MHPKIVSREDVPYEPSLFDRLKDWVERLRVSHWAFYAGLGWLLVAVQLAALWLDPAGQLPDIAPVVVYNGLFTPFLMALIHLLDAQGVDALEAMPSVLELSEADLGRYRHRISHMPFPMASAAGAAMLGLVIGMEVLASTPTRYATLDQARLFAPVFQVVDKSSAFLFGVVIYHTVRQLRLVNVITSRHVRVDLFNLAPLRAFSRLTAHTAVGLLVGIYGWMVINPDLWEDPLILGVIALVTLLAAAVFVWPLRNVHRLMVAAKESALHDLDLRFKATFSAFNARLDIKAFRETDELNGIISSLMIQHQRLSGVSTWPWRPNTVRFVLTAIALPLLLGVIQFLIERALGP
jgi:hypothetical protein